MLFAELIHVLDPEPHDAALNMAIDDALLRSATAPTLRIYRWARPAVSFGYFGKWEEVARAWPGRDMVRRPTGGGIVPHGEDLTYTLIVPRDHAVFALGPLESYRAIHEPIARALGRASLAPVAAGKISEACFENAARYDVLTGGRKVAGAAQRRTKFGLLHQGSIQCAFAAEDLAAGFAKKTAAVPMPAAIHTEASAISREKYSTAAWTRRR